MDLDLGRFEARLPKRVGGFQAKFEAAAGVV